MKSIAVYLVLVLIISSINRRSIVFQITHNLVWIVRKGSELESSVVSVERIREYSETATEVGKYNLCVGYKPDDLLTPLFPRIKNNG